MVPIVSSLVIFHVRFFLAAPEGVPRTVCRAAEDDPSHAPAPAPGLPNPLAPDPDPALVLAPIPDLAPGIPKKYLLWHLNHFPPQPLEVVWTHFWLSPIGTGVTPDPGPEVTPAPDHDLQTSVVTLQNHAVQSHRKSYLLLLHKSSLHLKSWFLLCNLYLHFHKGLFGVVITIRISFIFYHFM